MALNALVFSFSFVVMAASRIYIECEAYQCILATILFSPNSNLSNTVFGKLDGAVAKYVNS